MSSETLEEVIIEKQEEVKKPSKYSIFLINDDVTPFEFVIYVLMSVFNKNEEDAYKITMDVHKNGEGVAGSNYSKENAKNKLKKIKDLNQQYNLNLQAECREQK